LPAQSRRYSGAVPIPDPLADDLRVVVGQLTRRFREDRMLPPPQFAVLVALDREGGMTTSQLAKFEGVRHQSMAHTVGLLDDAGLVVRRPDPTDGRKTMIDLTARGTESINDFRAVAAQWIDEALADRFSPADRDQLRGAIELLRRLLD
jgi:DNA-binding MarR family transcriptional regulator